MIRRRTIPPMVILTAYTVLAVGSTAGLCWLAPLEYATGRWLGLAWILAGVVPALIDSYVVLSVLTARDRAWALPIAAISGGVGQLHAAGVLPETSVAVRGWVATLAVLLAVAVTARLKPLVGVVARAHRAEAAAEQAATTAWEAEREATVRAHEAEIVRLEDAAREASHRRTQEVVEAAHRRDLERTRTAHDVASHGAHAEPMEERTQAPRTAHAPRRTVVPPKRTVEAHGGDDLAVRRVVRAQWNAREDAARKTPNAAIARTLGIEPGPARALVSRWKKERTVAAEGTMRAVAGDR